MKRVIVHWTAGTHTASDLDKEHYHYLIEGTGRTVEGKWPVSANEVIKGDAYAAHTKGCNTGAIGVSLCCMAGAVESPFSSGKYPMTRPQWDRMTTLVADLCKQYKIAVTPQTVLSHAEVQKNLGIQQAGKWDIARLSFDPATVGATACGDRLRREVLARMNGQAKAEPAVLSDFETPTPTEPPKGTTTMNFFLERLKAFVAVIIPGITTAVMSGIEKASGFDIPASWELLIMSAVTGILVHQVPNKKP